MAEGARPLRPSGRGATPRLASGTTRGVARGAVGAPGRESRKRSSASGSATGRAPTRSTAARSRSWRCSRGAAPLIAEAFERRIYIRGSFAEISVLSGRRTARAPRRRGRRCLNGRSSGPGSRENGISSVRLEATNHDGLVLGKYLSAEKFLGRRRARRADRRHRVRRRLLGRRRPRLGLGRLAGRGHRRHRRSPTSRRSPSTRRSPGSRSVICDFATGDGRPVPVCGRSMLKRLIAELADHGLEARSSPRRSSSRSSRSRSRRRGSATIAG